MQLNKLDRILCVQDDDVGWQLTESYLGTKCLLTRARNRREVSELLEQEKFDIVLLDVQLYGSDFGGIEMCQTVKRLVRNHASTSLASPAPPPPPVILLTPYDSHFAKKGLLALGGDDVISSPIDFDRLTQTKLKLQSVR